MKRRTFCIYAANLIIAVTLTALCLIAFVPSEATPASTERAPLYSGRTDTGAVALMFNLYSGGDYALQIADALSAAQMSATFFIGGCWADDNNETVNALAAKGMEIGNHGYFHKDADKLSAQKNAEEIRSTDTLLTAILGTPPSRLFAPPSGAFSQTTLSVAEELGFTVVMWSRDTIDWRDKDKNTVVQRATKNVAAGEFVLMHPTEHTAAAIPEIIEYLKANGLTATTVSSLL